MLPTWPQPNKEEPSGLQAYGLPTEQAALLTLLVAALLSCSCTSALCCASDACCSFNCAAVHVQGGVTCCCRHAAASVPWAPWPRALFKVAFAQWV